MSGRLNMKPGVCLFLTILLVGGAIAYAEKMFGVPATVDAIDLKEKTMKVTYADPDSTETKQHSVYWDKSTEFIKEGPPPDMKESPANCVWMRSG